MRIGKYYPYDSALERRYAARLQIQKLERKIADWWYVPKMTPPERFDCGAGIRYTPDFKVLANNGGVEYHEVKGWNKSNAESRMRFKLAASRNPQHRWLWVTWDYHKGCWKQKEYKRKDDDV